MYEDPNTGDNYGFFVALQVLGNIAPAQPTLTLGTGVANRALEAGGVIQLVAESGSTTVLTFTDSQGHTVTKTVTGTGNSQAIVLAASDLGSAVNQLVDGSITVTAVSSYHVGNSSSTTTSLVLDTVAPVAPGVTLATDSGTSNSDGLTNNSLLNVTGLEPGATWQYSLNNGTTWLTGTGNTISGITGDGLHNVYVRQSDAAGNTSNTGNVAFVLDTTAPNVPTLALALDSLFNHDINGVTNTTVQNIDGNYGTTDVYHYATINGVKLSLPTLGGGSTGQYQTSAAPANPQTMLDVWNSFNGHNLEIYNNTNTGVQLLIEQAIVNATHVVM